jgi:hypothetical protein
MTNNDGNLSVDFLVGFSIFMIAFIWVATLVPNLFLGVSSHQIDFDAVAYRTGVILAEDPGAPAIPYDPWEYLPDTDKDKIERFGLAASKETPNILNPQKIDRFFDSTAFPDPEDYRQRAIFGDYPYHFNISLQEVGEDPRYVAAGEVRPENYGFIRKAVKIRHPSNATFDFTDYQKFRLNNTGIDGNVSVHDFSMEINVSRLQGNITNPITDNNVSYPGLHSAYEINPRWDEINITMEDFNRFKPSWVGGNLIDVNLTKVRIRYIKDYSAGLGQPPQFYDLGKTAGIDYDKYTWVNGNNGPYEIGDPNLYGLQDKDNISFRFPPKFFYSAADAKVIYINMTFQVGMQPGEVPMHYLNTSRSPPWSYSYNSTEVSQPYLTDAVLEVAVW